MRRARLLGVLLGAALTASLFAATPAQAAVGGCNSNTSVGPIIYRDTGGSFARNISAKVCVVYDTNSAKNSTAIYCRTDSGAGCDIRAEVLHAKLDEYDWGTGAFQKTWADDWLRPYASDYRSGWAWYGSDMVVYPCNGKKFQANDFNIRVRFAYNGVLKDVGNAFSLKMDPDC